MDRGFNVEAESCPHIEDPDTATGIETPGDEPADDAPEAPQRQPIVAFFTRRAVFSRDTGRWHKLPGGREHPGDACADASGTSDPR